MTNTSLLKTSSRLKKQAEAVVRKTQIIKLLRPLGRAQFVGSYRLNLMMRRDIDIVILAKKLSAQKVAAVTDALIAVKKFSSVRCIDAYTKKLPYMHRQYYWEIIVKDLGRAWKFDVNYLIPKDDDSVRPIRKWLRQITPEKRELILKIKQRYLKTPMLYSHRLYGARIYKAVLEQKIEDLDMFHSRIAISSKKK